ncbi:MAG: CBS domain-containing protein [Alphaproteobacteria bacterium]|nr:CBS domain-containing protein [Alphaproteobacteria bacterium]
MHAHQIMTRSVVTVTPDTSVIAAAKIMLERHVSGLPVVDEGARLVGVISEGDLLRRSEIGTQRKRGRLLRFFLGPSQLANDFIHEHGRKVAEVMTQTPLTITEDTAVTDIADLMERNNIKRLPVMRDGILVGIVSRANLLQAVASLARHIATPKIDDEQIRSAIIAALEKHDWCPFGLTILVRDGEVFLSGVIHDERVRRATIVAAENVAGVTRVHDQLSQVDMFYGVD